MRNILLKLSFYISSIFFITTCLNLSAQTTKNIPKILPQRQIIQHDEVKMDEQKSSESATWTCENNVQVRTAAGRSDTLLVLWNKKLYSMVPVPGLNGVRHYADKVNKLDWLEIPTKAMMFDTKLGQRILDHCMTPEISAANQNPNQTASNIDLMK